MDPLPPVGERGREGGRRGRERREQGRREVERGGRRGEEIGEQGKEGRRGRNAIPPPLSANFNAGSIISSNTNSTSS